VQQGEREALPLREEGVVNVPDNQILGSMIQGALKVAQDRSSRSLQTRIGGSELGWCRQQTALKVKGIQPSDSKTMWAAYVGTSLHTAIFGDLRPIFPEWLIECEEVAYTFPSGAEIVGHPDLIIPAWNMCLDLKTVDGIESVKRYGTSQNHKFQRWTYTAGAVKAGFLDGDKPLFYGNVYVDRSGKSAEVFVIVEEFDPTLESEIDDWLTDVIYAVQQGEDAHRDIAAPVCESICEFYSVCRGGLPVGENEIIDTPEVRQAVEQYVTAREEAKTAERLKNEAKAVLSGLNGVAGGYQIRTTNIAESDVPGFTRAASVRLEVVKIRT
jgi:hypothetical protein